MLAANHLIEALTGYIHWRAQDRVALKEGGADKLLRKAIATIDLEGGASVRSFPVRDVANDAMMVTHILPIRRAARDIFIRCAAVLVMTPVALPQAPPVELVQSLFDLTPAEARVARSLAAGETVEGIAAAGSAGICAACSKKPPATVRPKSSRSSRGYRCRADERPNVRFERSQQLAPSHLFG